MFNKDFQANPRGQANGVGRASLKATQIVSDGRKMSLDRKSPGDMRDELEAETLEPYQPPRILVRQARVDSDQKDGDGETGGKEGGQADKSRQRWWTKLTSSGGDTNGRQNLRHRLSQRLARLSSLDSTRSSSSMEVDSFDRDHLSRGGAPNRVIMPLISITSNDSQATSEQQQHQQQQQPAAGNISASQRRQQIYRDYYGRSRNGSSPKGRGGSGAAGRLGGGNDYDEEDDDDAFDDTSLPVPYSSSSMARSTVVRQHTSGDNNEPASYSVAAVSDEDPLDERQGLNSSVQTRTRREQQATRVSIDGSIISGLRISCAKAAASKGASGRARERPRRSKSPSSSSVAATNIRRGAGGRHSKRGFLGFASRFKLTKKHESIAKLQLSVLNSGIVSLKTLDRDLQSFLPKDRLSIKEFEQRVGLMRKYEVLSKLEYRSASKYETYVCKHAQQETNQPKNSYKKCIPYDYNRVVLRTLPNVVDSDYINASHVDSCLKPNAYIAAQGPNDNTMEDFWRMIWEQKTFVIVMLTKVFDFIRVMCSQYWPVAVNKVERYGNLEVTLLYEEPLADFVIRTIKLTKLKGGDRVAPSTPNEVNPADQAPLGAETAAAAGEPTDEEEDDDDEVDCCSDDTLSSGNSGLDNFDDNATRQNQRHANLVTVRSPKFKAKARLEGRRQRSSSPRLEHCRADQSASSPLPVAPQAKPATSRTVSAEVETGQKTAQLSAPNDGLGAARSASTNPYLHPTFNSAQFGRASSASLGSSEPQTPMSPRTPSSAGLDRSSATRRAVKKKRRVLIKNQRPKRTHFMVPSETQLLDDDDNDDEHVAGDATAEPDTAGAETEFATSGTRSNERIIYQFHYNSWASHTCPFINSLLHFRRRVRICMDEMSKSGRTGPTVVHCNDGCGRTGTYLCIDANLELAEEDNVLDIYNYTRKMRQSRKFLIENLDQYKFVYDTIEEAMFCGRTWFPVSELQQRLKHKSQRNPITKKNEYLQEYEKICRMTSKFSIGDCAGGHRVENREKNRDVSTVPPDNFRPYLTSFQTNDSTDYINAVFVDGYTRSKEYIVTEWPLHKTISDFWSLIYDHDCNSVILLANPLESSTYPSFLPSEKELRRKFGPVFSAEMVSYTHYQNIRSWIYTINKKIVSLTEVIAGVKSEAKTTQVFQITCWPQGHRVPTSTNALVELMNMVERWRQRTTYGPVCVVSLNGKSRAGVYCAANVAIEQVVQHSEVDVFQAVKTVRRHRPQLIENMTEYKYCYDLILHYVLHYVNNPAAGMK